MGVFKIIQQRTSIHSRGSISTSFLNLNARFPVDSCLWSALRSLFILPVAFLVSACSGAGYNSIGRTVYVLTVNSTNPAAGVTIGASPTDSKGVATGPTNLSLSYFKAAEVTLTAPATSDGSSFVSWSGCTTASATTCSVTMNANTTVTAIYTPPTTYTLNVNSTSPGVTVMATPADNVWRREGQMLYSSTYSPFVLEPTLIPPEGNPQVLTNASTVWKMWYSFAGDQGIFYAESLNGMNWSTYGVTSRNANGTPVVPRCLRSFVVENNGTYYLYCAPITPDGNTIDEYTSTDGVHFTLAYASVIHNGMGSWNYGWNNNSSGIVVNGTLYLFVEHSFIGIGLYTSTDFHTFTPVSLAIPDHRTQGPTVPFLVNGTWYMWVGAEMSTLPNNAEYAIQRWSAPALTGPWTNSELGFDFIPQTADEGVGTLYAETLDPFVIEVSGKTYLYYSANQGTPEIHQNSQIIKLAIADMPMSDLVQTLGGMDANGTITGATGFKLIYNAGTTVTLTAPTNFGNSAFASWTGCATSAGNTCTVVVNANTTVTANYN